MTTCPACGYRQLSPVKWDERCPGCRATFARRPLGVNEPHAQHPRSRDHIWHWHADGDIACGSCCVYLFTAEEGR